MADIKLKAGTPVVLEASGPAITNNTMDDADDANLDNTSVLAPAYDFELNCGFGSSVTALEDIYLILVPALDGTNFAEVDAANLRYQYNNLAGVFITPSTGTAARRLVIEGVEVGPYIYKAYLLNRSGQTISSTWSLTAYPVLSQVG